MARTSTNDIKKLQNDIHHLESTVVQLTRSLKKDGVTTFDHVKENLSHTAEAAREAARQQVAILRVKGGEKIIEAEEVVRKSPLRSVGFAFLGGMLASALVRRK